MEEGRIDQRINLNKYKTDVKIVPGAKKKGNARKKRKKAKQNKAHSFPSSTCLQQEGKDVILNELALGLGLRLGLFITLDKWSRTWPGRQADRNDL